MRPRMSAIAAEVERLYSMGAGDLRERTRRPEVVGPRQVACWIMHRRGRFSLHQIGAFFAVHHTTVMHSVQKIDARIGDDEIAHVQEVVDKWWRKD